MSELTMASACSDEIPAVILKQTQNLADLHAHRISARQLAVLADDQMGALRGRRLTEPHRVQSRHLDRRV
jgi:hypothetical protein